uniref:Uncharacterized protein n=1 Tax=Nothobranchius furzeri TaxID=105023 RepID=A0A8C6P485_NOTFU
MWNQHVVSLQTSQLAPLATMFMHLADAFVQSDLQVRHNSHMLPTQTGASHTDPPSEPHQTSTGLSSVVTCSGLMLGLAEESSPCVVDVSRKRVKALESLLAVIQTVPLADPQSVELQDGTEKLRSKFRQVFKYLCCSSRA